MTFLKNIIEEGFFEETESCLVFYPDGKYVAGKIKSYIIQSDDDKQNIYLFLKRSSIYSLTVILFCPLVLFGSMPFSELVFHDYGDLISLVIASIIIIVFRIWYDYKVKKITTGFDKIISRRKFREVKFGWKMWLLGFIFAFLFVLEGIIAKSGATHFINSLK